MAALFSVCRTLPALTVALFLLPAAADQRDASPRLLGYVDSSSGLEVPGFEGGDTEFEMGDVNGDGHLDLVSVGDHGNPQINADEEGIMVWFGNGTGTWTYAHAGYLGYGGIALGDVNGDGLMDIAYGIHHNYSGTDLGDQLLEVAVGNGSGVSWTPWDDGLAEDGQSWGMFSTDFGDVDGDGDLDVGSTGFGSMDGMHVYLNRRDGSWARSMGFLEGNSFHVFLFGEVDGDGHLDAVAAKQEGSVWLGDGEGSFTVADGNLPPLDPYDVRVGPSFGDVDGDGHDDFAYCNDSRHAEVWLWRGGLLWLDVSLGIPRTGTCEHTALHDMDGDGKTDLVTFGVRQVFVFGGDGTGQVWSQIASFTVPETPGGSQAFRVGGDVDHNGLPDIVLVTTKRVSMFETANVVRCYREASSASTLRARVVSPGPHRRLLAGATTFVDWAAAVPSGQSATVAIELSASGTAGPWEPIASGLPNNGRYQWRVPARFCEDCRLRVTVTTASGSANAVSPQPFAISRRPDPLVLRFSDRSTLVWTDTLGRDRYDLYRSDWQRFVATGAYTQDPSVEPGAARHCDLAATSQADGFTPAPGSLVIYLVTGYRLMNDGVSPSAPMAEGTLGQRSDTEMRANGASCPR